MAKKFFYNRVYNTKRRIINLVIIGVCIIGVIICFIFTSNFQGENHNTPSGTLNIKKEVTIEVNEIFEKEIFFSKIENVDINDIKIIYPDNYDVSKIGNYDITIRVNNEDYTSKLYIVDTIKPVLVLKEVTINKGDNYTPKSFVENCTDNSNNNCIIDFYSGIDSDGNPSVYSNYKDEGIYAIKIAASDEAGNQIIEETKLTIKKYNNQVIETPVVCKYGNNEYDKDKYLLTIDVTTNNCAVSLDLYKDPNITKELTNLMATERSRILKDISKLNLSGTAALNQNATVILNSAGDGIVGYELRITVSVTNDNITKTVADYKLNKSGKRTFIENPYNLSK